MMLVLQLSSSIHVLKLYDNIHANRAEFAQRTQQVTEEMNQLQQRIDLLAELQQKQAAILGLFFNG